MDFLFLPELFANDGLSYRGEHIKVVCQMAVIVHDRMTKLCLCGVGNKINKTDYTRYYLFAKKENTFLPLSRSNICELIDVLTQFEANESLSALLKELRINEEMLGKGVKTINLSSRLLCVIDDNDPSTPVQRTVGLWGEKEFSISVLGFHCSSGIDQRIFMRLNSIDLVSIASCHMLAGIKINIDDNMCGVYYPLGIKKDNNDFVFNGINQETYYALVTSPGKFKYSSEEQSPVDLLDFIYSIIGFKKLVNHPDHSFCRWFQVVIPIENLNIAQDFGLGSVTFVKRDNSEIMRILSEADDMFGSYETYALVHVNEVMMFDAYQKAKREIENAIYLLMNLWRDDSPCHIHGLEHVVRSKSLKHYDTNVALSELVYLECVFPQTKLLCNTKFILNENVTNIDAGFVDSLSCIEDFERKLMQADEEPQGIHASIFSALKWLLKAWESNDSDDQVIYANTAIEFLVAREKGVPLLTKSKRRSICDELQESIAKHAGDVLDSDGIKKLVDKFSKACTDTPFMAKLRSLIKRCEIPVTESEMELIGRLREKRNDIVHGKKSIEIDKQELRLVCEIVSTIALYKLRKEQ